MVDLEFLLARRKIDVSEWLVEKNVSNKETLLAAINSVGAAIPSDAKINELLSKVIVSEVASSLVDEVRKRFTRKENENKNAADVTNVAGFVQKTDDGFIVDVINGFGEVVERVELDLNEQVVSRVSLPVKSVERKARKSKTIDAPKTEE